MLAEFPKNARCTAFKVEDSEWVTIFHEQTYGAFRVGKFNISFS